MLQLAAQSIAELGSRFLKLEVENSRLKALLQEKDEPIAWFDRKVKHKFSRLPPFFFLWFLTGVDPL